jgi:riboflavin-specific deaminase-like protein
MARRSPQEHREPSAAADAAWALLLGVARLRRDRAGPEGEVGVWLGEGGSLQTGRSDDPRAQAVRGPDGTWHPGPALAKRLGDLLGLYLPVCAAGISRPVIIGHLGQSVDGQIATESGDSCFVTGPENLVHLHRMRALCDAVLVGAGTVAADDPRLTTRLVEGPNPVRVIIDPQRRLPDDRRVFAEADAPTLVACQVGQDGHTGVDGRHLCLPREGDGLSLSALVSALGDRGLHALFVEGGGVTVSRWMEAGLLDRLQVAIAPVLVGSGRQGLQLPPAASMQACRRPACRVYRMGEDLLWDFDLRSERRIEPSADHPLSEPLRVL